MGPLSNHQWWVPCRSKSDKTLRLQEAHQVTPLTKVGIMQVRLHAPLRHVLATHPSKMEHTTHHSLWRFYVLLYLSSDALCL
jgi:hypothetical protein